MIILSAGIYDHTRITTYIRIQVGTAVRRARARGRDRSITTRRILVVSQTNREFVRRVGSGHIEVTALRVVDIQTIVRRGNLVVAGFETELVAADEATSKLNIRLRQTWWMMRNVLGPVLNLGNRGIVFGRGQVVRKDQTAQGVTSLITVVKKRAHHKRK